MRHAISGLVLAVLFTSVGCGSSSSDGATPATNPSTGGAAGEAGSGGASAGMGGLAGSGGAAGDASAGNGGSSGGGGDSGGSASSGTPASLDVMTTDGPIHGTMKNGARVFRGIPFAAPPTGDNRFKPPQPVTPWTAPLNATNFGSECSQVSFTTGGVDPSSHEDCLYLNVFTPDPLPPGPLPTMVWIHGGAFIVGSASQAAYDASLFAQTTGTVVVSTNYRLGPFGFLAHPSLAQENPDSPANAGIEDQRAALRWVQANIAAFGGDQNNVTIFGESAGAISVGLHLLSPKSAGLFHKAIAESMAADDAHLTTIAEAGTMAEDLGTAVGCDPKGDLLTCLRAAKPEDLAGALGNKTPPKGGLFNGSITTAVWLPVMDGVGVPDQPANLLSSGAFNKVPLLLGTNHDEAALFFSGLLGDVPLQTAQDYMDALTRTYGDAAAEIHTRYPEASYASLDDALAHVSTDSFFTCPARRVARAAVKTGLSVFRYQFDATLASGLFSNLGACHSAEIPFVFGTKDVALGSAGDAGQPLVNDMMSYWSNMAKTGDPNGTGLPMWPAYDGTSDPYEVLNVPPSTATGLDSDVCDYWDTLPPIVLPKTY